MADGELSDFIGGLGDLALGLGAGFGKNPQKRAIAAGLLSQSLERRERRAERAQTLGAAQRKMVREQLMNLGQTLAGKTEDQFEKLIKSPTFSGFLGQLGTELENAGQLTGSPVNGQQEAMRILQLAKLQAEMQQQSDIEGKQLEATATRLGQAGAVEQLGGTPDQQIQAAGGGAAQQTPEQIGAETEARERAKALVRQETIQNILGQFGLGVSPTGQASAVPPGPSIDPEIVQASGAPFGPDIGASADAQQAIRLLMGSRAFLLAGETQMASGMLSQARFLMESSPNIQREKEMNKPLSPEVAAIMGEEIGTTLADVQGRIPPGIGEQAEQRGAGTARGRGRVAGEEQLAFIDEASEMIGSLLNEIKTDPGVVGIRGSLRATGQTAVGVLGDLGMRRLVDVAEELAFENTDLSLDEANGLFDSPTLSVLDILENSIGLILARLRTPSGRIPVDIIQRSISDVGLKGLKSSEQVENRLNFVLSQLQRRGGAVQRRFNIPEAPGQKPKRFRLEGGKFVPVE